MTNIIDEDAVHIGTPMHVDGDLTINAQAIFTGDGRIITSKGGHVRLAGGFSADDEHWCFDISQGGKVTGALPKSGYVTPQQFGASAVGRSSNDGPAILAAMAYAPMPAPGDPTDMEASR